MEIGLVSCTKSKRNRPAQPRNLYDESTLFRKARNYCERFHDDWYILSAKYHVLDPVGSPVEPYEETLNEATVDERQQWAKTVFDEFEEMGLLSGDHTLVFHAGRRYYDQLLPLLEDAHCTTEIPLEGLRIGERFAWYNERLEND